jgi:hypothetical protein
MLIVSCGPGINTQPPVSSQLIITPVHTRTPQKTPSEIVSFSTPQIFPTGWSGKPEGIYTEFPLTQTPVFEKKFDPELTYDSRAILKDLVEELHFQMRASEYRKFLVFQDEWEHLASRQCRWQAELFFANSSPLEQEDECLYKQYIQRIDILLILLCRKNGTTGECRDSKKYRDMLQN